MNVLIVKISSMGDVIHTLPALSDAAKHHPNIAFDWVVDRAFAEIPAWHPTVRTVIPSAHRSWKQHWLSSWRSGDIPAFLRGLRDQRYDLVIDAQSSLKSAVFTRLARAKLRAGLDANSVREYGAHLVYQQRYFINKQQHATHRIRHLFAAALGYVCDLSQPRFAIQAEKLSKTAVLPAAPYVVFVPNASWQSKTYPEHHWQSLIDKATQDFFVVLPWGNAAEKERAQRIARDHPKVMVLPRMTLAEIAYLLYHSQGVISVDTGLGHLAAALNVATVSLYGATDPKLIGTQGEMQCHLQPDIACLGCYQRQCRYQGALHAEPVCLDRLSPDKVWRQFQDLIAR